MPLTGAKTYLQLQQRVSRNCLGSVTIATTATRPTLAEVKETLNDVQREICGKNEWSFLFKDGTPIAVSASQHLVTLADDCLMPYGFRFEAQQIKPTYMSREQFDLRFPGGFTTGMSNAPYPTFYMPAPPSSAGNRQVDLVQPPSASLSLDYRYKRRVADMSSDAGYPGLPPEFNLALEYGSTYKLMVQQGNPGAGNYKAMYEEQLDDRWLEEEQNPEFVNTLRDYYREIQFRAAVTPDARLFWGN